VDQSLSQAALEGAVPIRNGQHPAHAAAVGGKLVLKLTKDASHMGGRIDQGHPASCLGKVEGGPDSADTCTHNQCLTLFYIHNITSKSYAGYILEFIFKKD
jgi:hypothetical protein